jgi:hypothetical protein
LVFYTGPGQDILSVLKETTHALYPWISDPVNHAVLGFDSLFFSPVCET